MRNFLAALLILLVAGCSGATDGDDLSGENPDPISVADEWLKAVAGGDTARIDQLVEPTGVIVVAAVENNLSSAEMAATLESGLSDQLATAYWTAFGDDLVTFLGSPIESVTIGEETPIAQPDGFTSVAISSESAAGHVVLRKMDAGWQIDFAATVGPALVGPLGEYLEAALAGDHADVIGTAYRDFVVPALEAALAVRPDNSALAFEAEYIKQLSATG